MQNPKKDCSSVDLLQIWMYQNRQALKDNAPPPHANVPVLPPAIVLNIKMIPKIERLLALVTLMKEKDSMPQLDKLKSKLTIAISTMNLTNTDYSDAFAKVMQLICYNRRWLHFAAKEGKQHVLEQLLEIPGIKVNTKDDFNKTPLMYAAKEGDKESNSVNRVKDALNQIDEPAADERTKKSCTIF